MKSAFSIALAASLFLTTLSLVSTPLLLTVKWTGSLGELASSSTRPARSPRNVPSRITPALGSVQYTILGLIHFPVYPTLTIVSVAGGMVLKSKYVGAAALPRNDLGPDWHSSQRHRTPVTAWRIA
jgi:hypothetical protein